MTYIFIIGTVVPHCSHSFVLCFCWSLLPCQSSANSSSKLYLPTRRSFLTQSTSFSRVYVVPHYPSISIRWMIYSSKLLGSRPMGSGLCHGGYWSLLKRIDRYYDNHHHHHHLRSTVERIVQERMLHG